MSRFQEPFPVAGVPTSGTTLPIPGTPAPTPQPVPSVDLSLLTYRLDAMSAQLERMFADYVNRDNRTVAQLQAIDQKVDAVKEKPGAIESTVSNRYFQIIAAAAGAWLAAQQVK
jgi:hypothetical protein